MHLQLIPQQHLVGEASRETSLLLQPHHERLQGSFDLPLADELLPVHGRRGGAQRAPRKRRGVAVELAAQLQHHVTDLVHPSAHQVSVARVREELVQPGGPVVIVLDVIERPQLYQRQAALVFPHRGRVQLELDPQLHVW